MPQNLAQNRMNFLQMLAQNPRGWGPSPPPQDMQQQPSAQPNNLAAFGPIAEAVMRQAAPEIVHGRNSSVGGYLAQKARNEATPENALSVGLSATPLRALPLAAGVLGMTTFPSAAGESKSDDVIRLQEQLKAGGYYTGKIDGVMGDVTRDAKAAFERDQLQKQRLQVEADKAAAAKAETDRKSSEGDRKASERATGEKRLLDIQDQDTGFGAAFRKYGPAALGILGIAGGIGTRVGMTRAFRTASEAAAAKADKLIGGASVPERIGGLNTFWQEGGASAVPFKSTSGKAVAVRNAAPSATTLYSKAPWRENVGAYLKPRDVGVGAVTAAEVGGSWTMLQNANQDLQRSQDAVAKDPSEANIERLQYAKRKVAYWDTAYNAGRGFGFGYFSSIPKTRYQAMRPNVAKAEGERLQIEQVLKKSRARQSARAKKMP